MTFRSVTTPPLVFLAALILLFEEWLWDGLVALFQRLARLPAVARAETAIAALPPYPAMALFLLPAVALFPVKLAALWLIATGKAVLGIAVIIAAKVVGTALVARLFTLCRPSLLSLDWFRRLHDWFQGWKHRILDRVRAMPAWQAAKSLTTRLKTVLRSRKSWLMTRFRAAMRLRRRRYNGAES
jgi:hypothetical protein